MGLSSERFTIVLVDDYPSHGERLENAVRFDKRFQFIAQFYIDRAALVACPSLNPDIVIMDVNQTTMNFVELYKALTPICGFIVITMTSWDPNSMEAGMKAGARMFLDTAYDKKHVDNILEIFLRQKSEA